ncbi:UNVERIFIED_CONTAM: hypothetical protein Slati_0846000, partial [Sesamum latifolium]
VEARHHRTPQFSGKAYHRKSYLSYEQLTPCHRAYFVAISKTREPVSYNQEARDPKWVHAMNQELDALEANDTCTLTNLPPGKKAIGAKWGMTNHYALSAKGISKDISNSKILYLSQYMQDPRKPYLSVVMRVLRYLKDTPGQEAEYRAMAYTTTELVWLKYLLNDLSIHLHHPMKLICDNNAALPIAANPIFHKHTKHIELDCHFVHEILQDGIIATAYVPSHHQLRTYLLKPLDVTSFTFSFASSRSILHTRQLEGEYYKLI